MSAPISIRLDDDIRVELETQARGRGVGLATLLRELATTVARDARRARIRAASQAIGEQAAQLPETREFYRDWGTPNADAVR